jgi:TfoX/Sxy family transcriptional regulator of competence genes
MPWEKSPPELVASFEAVAPGGPNAVERKMFGYPSAFVGGHHFMGLHEHRFTVRLSDEDLAELLALPGAAPFEPMAGRTMKGYGVLPPDVVTDPERLRTWVGRAYAHAESRPPKESKPRAPRKASKPKS